jgi:acetyl esterase
MTLNPQAKALLEQLEALGAPPMSQMSLEENRQNVANFKALGGEVQSVANVEERTVPVEGDEIKVRIYTPEGNGPFPIFVYYHGGGFVIGDLDTVDTPLRALTNASGCIVVSVDYRLSPEQQFPVPAEDAYAATKWVAETAASFNGDPSRIAVGGDSAGGNLAAVVSLMAKEHGGPAIAYQALIYPCTNCALETESHQVNGEGYLLTRDSMEWFYGHYLRNEEDKLNPYASPLLAEDLSGLPPALVITAEYDPLRDEGEAYAARLKEAGVSVEMTRYDGMIHGFFWMAGIMEQGKGAIEQVASGLRGALK